MKKFLGKILSCDFGMSSIALCTACLVAILAVAGSAHAAAGESIAIERYVFAVSANNGGKERPRLRYAESDARAFANVLSQMGGVPKANVHMVAEPTIASLQKQLDALDKKLLATKAARSGKGANAANGAEISAKKCWCIIVAMPTKRDFALVKKSTPGRNSVSVSMP
jgi:hypothetical protein